MGRPAFEVTKEKRELVQELAAQGVPQKDIAKMVGLRSTKTLRKHFRKELDLGALDANHKVAKSLYEMAISKKSATATIFWLRCRARWSVKSDYEWPGEPVEPTFGPYEGTEDS